MKLLSSIIAEDIGRFDEALADLESDIVALKALMKTLGTQGDHPSSQHLVRVWQAHEKIGELYDTMEKARGAQRAK